MDSTDSTDSIDLREYFKIIQRWWWLLLLGAALGAGAGYAATLYTPLEYRTTATLVVGRFSQLADTNTGDLLTGVRLAQSYAQLAGREPVLQAVVDSADLSGLTWTDLKKKVTAAPIRDTQLLEIQVQDTDPVRAAIVANGVAEQLIQQSPRSGDPEKEAYQQFIKDQLDRLKVQIPEGQQQLQELQAALQIETTAEGIEQRQADIKSLQAKLDTWQGNFASLLTFIKSSEEGVNVLTVIEPAVVPENPTNRPLLTIALAAVVGLMLAGGLAFLLEYLDDTVKTAGDVQRALALPTLGMVPKINTKTQNGGQIIDANEEFSPVAEAYRTLRTNIQFSSVLMNESGKTLLVTSAMAGEGKSTTAANLSAVLAQAGQQVILVDADLRRPKQHKVFNLPNETGLTNLVLNKNIDPDTVLQKTPVKGMRLLTSGPLPPNAADLLASEAMGQVIAALTAHADIVIFDTPPLLAVTDAGILATRVGGAVLVLEAGRNRTQLCQHALESLTRVGVRPLGVVLNRYDYKRDSSGGYYYNQYYASDEGKRKKKSRKTEAEMEGSR
jgi:non-specific protein-tyrosine kinase